MNQNCSQNSISWAQNIPKMRLRPLGELTALPKPPSWVEWGKEGRGAERKGKGEGRGRGGRLTP